MAPVAFASTVQEISLGLKTHKWVLLEFGSLSKGAVRFVLWDPKLDLEAQEGQVRHTILSRTHLSFQGCQYKEPGEKPGVPHRG